MAELKPCPFCGGEAKQWYCTPQGHFTANFFGALCHGVKAEYNVIICGKCGCKTKVYAHKSRAFTAWNRRAESEELIFTRRFLHEHGLEFALASAWNRRAEDGR